MRARVEADNRITSTTDGADRGADRRGRAAAQRVRRADRVPAGALLPDPDRPRSPSSPWTPASLRRVDPDADGMAPCGAGPSARQVQDGDPRTSALRGRRVTRRRRRRTSPACTQLLREHERRSVMAGDTHDLEYYLERCQAAGTDRRAPLGQRRWGGLPQLRDGAGVAGVARACRTGRSTRDRDAVVAKIESTTPRWKRPRWVWTQAASAPGRSPPSGCRRPSTTTWRRSSRASSRSASSPRPVAVRMLPWAVPGRLRWSDLQASPGWRPEGRGPDELVEIAMPMRTPARPAPSRP